MFSRVAVFAYAYVACAAFVVAMPGGQPPPYTTVYTTVSQGHTVTVTSVVTTATTVTKPVTSTSTVVVTQPGTTVATTTTVAVPTTVTVTSTPTSTSAPVSQCNTGELQCCNSVQAASSSGVGLLLGLLGVVLSDLTTLVGVTCSPITAIGLGGNSCTAQPVCCQNNSFNGIIAIGCSPVNLNL